MMKLIARKVNPFRPVLRQINVRQFKMTTILELFNALGPYIMTFSFQILCVIFEKIGQGRTVPRLCCCALPYHHHHHQIQHIGFASITG